MSEEVIQADTKFVCQTYEKQPIVLIDGSGPIVRDIEGKEYIDFVAGVAVNNVGHCHPLVIESIKRQAEQLMHTSNLYYQKQQVELAKELAKLTGLDKFFFCNSGTEAVEAALKFAVKYTGKKGFIATYNGFHGRTLGSLSVTWRYREPSKPLLFDTKFVPYDDPDAIRKAMGSDTAAVIVEPVQGEGGVNVPSDDFLSAVRELCDDFDVLLILDEIQTGFGRTGEWFAKDHSGVEPDIMTMAKALGGGFPIGATGVTNEIASAIDTGDHASTLGGNPLACSAALASIRAIKEEKLVERSKDLGAYLIRSLGNLNLDFVKQIRGKGLMVGIELLENGNGLLDFLRRNGILVNLLHGNIIRLVPPLVIEKEHIDTLIARIKAFSQAY